METSGTSYTSRFPVEVWISRFRRDFGSNPHVNFHEIPMIGAFDE